MQRGKIFMHHTYEPGSEPKLLAVPPVFIGDSLHFETEYLVLRLTDKFREIEKREQLIRNVIQCINSAIKDAAEMGLLRKECALYKIKIDSDKIKAQTQLLEQLAELGEQHKSLEAVLSAVKEASKSPRFFTPEEIKSFSVDSIKIVLASLNGRIIRFENLGGDHRIEPIETSDPRVVVALIHHQMGHPVVIL
ncbi:MAG TPA: hypothetical protein VED16_05180 [Candidatus Acidoferrum sp.]|nr:hypothetical protein [Candidatus Acidoferrum sp.]